MKRMVAEMGQALLSALILLQVHLSLAQFEGCPMVSDPDKLANMVSATISLDGRTPPPLVVVRRSHVVCVSTGPEVDTVSSLSLLIEYECSPSAHPSCASTAAPSNSSANASVVLLQQFDFGCTFVGGAEVNDWTPRQFGATGSRVPSADFETAPRDNCSVCLEEGVAESFGFQQLLYLDPVTRCLACSSRCASAGMGRCFGVGNTMCCNYFSNGTCVNLCPNTTQPDSEYNCQGVVVGFEEKVYMAEEGRARLELPVVVKEGQLTQRVTFLVTIEDRTTTVGEDYLLYNQRVHLVPRRNRGKVLVEIFEDRLLEDNEEFVVNLELKHGSAAVDISSTIVLIMGDQEEEHTGDPTENATMATTQSTPTIYIENGCEAEFDTVWGLHWPRAAQRTTASVSCGQDNKGTATRKCLVGEVWGSVNVSLCENVMISQIGEMAKELFSQSNVQVSDVLEVLRELADVASSSAATNMSQLPQDIVTASEIVSGTVELLLLRASGNGSGEAQVEINETIVVVEVLSILLTEQNKVGFSSLENQGSTTDSRAVLNTAEQYVLYLGQALVEDGTNPGHLEYSRDNLVLTSQRRNSEDMELGSRVMVDVTFSGRNGMKNTVSKKKPVTLIAVPGALLSDHYKGNVSITSLFFRDLHTLLPLNFTNGTAPRSSVISSEIYGQQSQPSRPLVFEDNPIELTFTIELNDTNEVPKCAFWDFSKGVEESGWSTAGLRTESVTRDGNTVTVVCSSTHLTSFAVLVDVGGAKIDHMPLQVVSYIGISISIACLFLTILFFASIGKKLFSTVHNFIHLNLSISLFMAYVIFAVGIEMATSNQAACKVVAALIQYFLLAAFCWMMCEGIMLYLMLVVVFSRVKEKWWFFLILGWGLPIVFVVIGLSAVLDEYGVRDSDGQLLYCWLSSGNGKHAIWTFVAPMLGIVLVNSVFLALVLRSIYISKSSQDSRNKKGQKTHSLAKYIVKASLILLPLLGLTWVFGLFAVNENTAVFAWLFTILNSLQGVSIFAFHVLRNDRVWGRFRKSMTDPDGFLRSFSSRRTTRSSIGMSSSRFSKPGESEIEMRAHRGPVSATSGLASHAVMEPDIFEPREDTSSSGEPAADPTPDSPEQNDSTTEANSGNPNSSGAADGCEANSDTTSGCASGSDTSGGENSHTTSGQYGGLPSHRPAVAESSYNGLSRGSNFSYEQLCKEIAAALNGISRTMNNSTEC